MKIGNTVLLKQGLRLVKAVVIDIDLTFITLRMEYKKGQYCDIKIKNNSKDILKIKGIDTEAFENQNDIFKRQGNISLI